MAPILTPRIIYPRVARRHREGRVPTRGVGSGVTLDSAGLFEAYPMILQEGQDPSSTEVTGIIGGAHGIQGHNGSLKPTRTSEGFDFSGGNKLIKWPTLQAEQIVTEYLYLELGDHDWFQGLSYPFTVYTDGSIYHDVSGAPGAEGLGACDRRYGNVVVAISASDTEATISVIDGIRPPQVLAYRARNGGYRWTAFGGDAFWFGWINGFYFRRKLYYRLCYDVFHTPEHHNNQALWMMQECAARGITPGRPAVPHRRELCLGDSLTANIGQFRTSPLRVGGWVRYLEETYSPDCQFLMGGLSGLGAGDPECEGLFAERLKCLNDPDVTLKGVTIRLGVNDICWRQRSAATTRNALRDRVKQCWDAGADEVTVATINGGIFTGFGEPQATVEARQFDVNDFIQADNLGAGAPITHIWDMTLTPMGEGSTSEQWSVWTTDNLHENPAFCFTHSGPTWGTAVFGD